LTRTDNEGGCPGGVIRPAAIDGPRTSFSSCVKGEKLNANRRKGMARKYGEYGQFDPDDHNVPSSRVRTNRCQLLTLTDRVTGGAIEGFATFVAEKNTRAIGSLVESFRTKQIQITDSRISWIRNLISGILPFLRAFTRDGHSGRMKAASVDGRRIRDLTVTSSHIRH
jgi:hypothetical protein